MLQMARMVWQLVSLEIFLQHSWKVLGLAGAGAIVLKPKRALQAVIAWPFHLQCTLESCQTSLRCMERRAMSEHLSGAETGRLFMCALEEWNPHGPAETWRWLHARRIVLELQAHWIRSMRLQGVVPTEALWDLVVESGYQRAVQELEDHSWSKYGEQVWLQTKINYWRQWIPEACGTPGNLNMLEQQRAVQLQPPPGEFLAGDLVAWRQSDLADWFLHHSGEKPFA